MLQPEMEVGMTLKAAGGAQLDLSDTCHDPPEAAEAVSRKVAA